MSKHTTKTEWAVIDIETAPQPQHELDRWLPDWVEWNERFFDPAAVKTGNLKDPVKINEKIEQALIETKAAHIRTQTERREEVIKKAALNPNTGWIFGVGVALPGDKVYSRLTLEINDEPEIIKHCWDIMRNTRMLINHALFNFDLIFLMHRSMILDIPIPYSVYGLRPTSGSELFLFNSPNKVTLVDTLQEAEKRMKFGGLYKQHPITQEWEPVKKPSLNIVAKALLGDDYQKTDIGGKLPWDVAREDFDLACEYTEQDARLTRDVAKKMQLIECPHLHHSPATISQ